MIQQWKYQLLNSLYKKNEKFIFKNNNFNYNKLNGINFIKPDLKFFHYLKILNYKFKNTYFEIILVVN